MDLDAVDKICKHIPRRLSQVLGMEDLEWDIAWGLSPRCMMMVFAYGPITDEEDEKTCEAIYKHVDDFVELCIAHRVGWNAHVRKWPDMAEYDYAKVPDKCAAVALK